MSSATTGTTSAVPRRAALTDPGYQAFVILRTGFTVAPILFGLDKFANLLVDWPTYLAPRIDDLVPGELRPHEPCALGEHVHAPALGLRHGVDGQQPVGHRRLARHRDEQPAPLRVGRDLGDRRAAGQHGLLGPRVDPVDHEVERDAVGPVGHVDDAPRQHREQQVHVVRVVDLAYMYGYATARRMG